MALTLGTNVGFVSTRPTSDPNGTAVTSDGSSFVVKDTAPTGALKIVEVGWYKASGTTSSNTQVGLYADSSGTAGSRLQVTGDQASGTSAGWVVFSGLNWPVTAGTAYWLGMQQDAHTGTSQIDSASSGGSGIDTRTTQTALTDPYGGGAVSDADGMYAIYALYQSAPTIALNSPADGSSTSDTTPDLTFTGTDAQGDAVRYNIQIDTSNAFDSQSGGTFGNTGTSSTDYANSVADSGAFAKGTLSAKGNITKVTYRTRSDSGTVHAKGLIYSDVAGVPTTLLASSAAVDITTTLQGYDFSFSGVTLPAGDYWVGIVTDGVLRNYYDATGTYHDTPAGFSYASPPTTFPAGGGSGVGAYEAYATYKLPLIDAVSGTDAGFANSDGTPEVIDSYSETNAVTGLPLPTSATIVGQTFNAGASGSFNQAKFYLNKVGSPTGNAVAKLYAHTATYGTNGVPTGAALATSNNFDVSTLTGTPALITFTFSTPYTVTSGTKYCVSFEYSGGDGSNYIEMGADNTSPSHGGNIFYWNGSSWGYDAGYDLSFYTYVADIDPFVSGQDVTYTPQSALPTTTLYWKVAPIDPSGSNTYGAWSATRSLTISGSSDATINAGVQTSTSSIQTSVRTVLKEPSVLSTTTQLQTPTPVIKKLPSVLTSSASIQSPTVAIVQNITIEPAVLSSAVGLQTPALVGRVSPATLGVSSGLQAPSLLLTTSPSVLSSQTTVQSPTVSVSESRTISPSVLATSVSLLDIGKTVNKAIPVFEAASSAQAIGKSVNLAIPTSEAAVGIQAPGKAVSLAPSTLISTSSVQTSEKSITKAPTTFSIASSLTAPEQSALKQISELFATSSVLDPVVTVSSGTTFSASVLSASTSIQTASREVKKTASVLSVAGSLPTGSRSISKQASVFSAISALQAISLAIQQNRTANPQVLAALSSLVVPVISFGGSSLTDDPFYDGSLTEDPATLKSLADPAFYNSSMTEEAAESNSLADTVFYDGNI